VGTVCFVPILSDPEAHQASYTRGARSRLQGQSSSLVVIFTFMSPNTEHVILPNRIHAYTLRMSNLVLNNVKYSVSSYFSLIYTRVGYKVVATLL